MERDTKQRRAIRELLASAGRPLSPQEILDDVKSEVPGIGIATVYRTVNMLVEDGWATAVELPEGPVRFERAGKGHHHHFVCTGCAGVWDVEGCPSDVRKLTPRGFKLEAHEILLYGRCRECAV